MKRSYDTLSESRTAVTRRLKLSRYVNKLAFAAALSGGISIGYSSAEEPPVIPDSASLAIMLGAGAATGIDSKRALKKCKNVVSSYAISQSFTGNPETTTKLTIAGGDLQESSSDDPTASQSYRTRNSAVQAENAFATYLGPYMAGAGGLLIGNRFNPEVDASVAESTSNGSYILGGTLFGVGLSIAVAREFYLSQSESAYLRQIDNIQSAGNLEF